MVYIVSKVVGSFIENDILIKNDKIIEDKLLEYSGGFVESFEVISESKDKDGLFKVKLKAKIAQQTVVEKLRSMKIDVISVSGSNLKAQLETQETMKKEGGKLINSIMEEYPNLWQAKQISEPKIANGKLALQIEASVDRTKYLEWADKLCKVLEKSADCKTLRSYVVNEKSESKLNEDRFSGGNCSIGCSSFLYKTPKYLKFNDAKEPGCFFSIVRNFSLQGCELQGYLFYKSNPLFDVVGIDNKRYGEFFSPETYLLKYLPNRLNINVLDQKSGVLLNKKIGVVKDRFTNGYLWSGYVGGFGISGHFCTITPFVVMHQPFSGSDLVGRYSSKCIIKADLPIDGIEVGDISKIVTGFSIEK